MPNDMSFQGLPATSELLTSGGDTRIVLDPATGASIYGCRPYPDPGLLAFGSSTASIISTNAYAAADALRLACAAQLRTHAPAVVYAGHAQRQRAEILSLCGLSSQDDVQAVLAASGTDLHLLVAQWLRPQTTVMVVTSETGSGVEAAVQGRHFNGRAACGQDVAIGAPVGEWRGDLVTLAVRAGDGTPRDSAAIDADCMNAVNAAAADGRRVLLILTDVSKTGMIVPGIDVVLALRRRWPGQVEVLLDGCQFRLAAATVQAYLAHDFLVALTGSKFIGGPTFCGALLVPPATAARCRDRALSPGAQAYANAGDWPAGWPVARDLPHVANFGLLLRWEAALSELRAFAALPGAAIDDFLRRFELAVDGYMNGSAALARVPVAPPRRAALGLPASWDARPSIFPFLIYTRAGSGRRPLRRDETEILFRRLRNPPAGSGARAIQVGQPVACGERDGVAVSALRLCVSAPMLVRACRDDGAELVLTDALAALDQLALLAAEVK